LPQPKGVLYIRVGKYHGNELIVILLRHSPMSGRRRAIIPAWILPSLPGRNCLCSAKVCRMHACASLLRHTPAPRYGYDQPLLQNLMGGSG